MTRETRYSGKMYDSFTNTDLDQLLAEFEFPEQFSFGCSTAGYQVEGGFNGQDDPKNNWYYFEERGQGERTGNCSRFLELYEEDFQRAHWMGLDMFRLGLEWARLQPGIDPELKQPPDFSSEAVELYCRMLSSLHDHGLSPIVTLHHFTHPLWAGLDFWLDREKVVELFPRFIEYAVKEINTQLVEKYACPPIPFYVTMNEPFVLPLTTYVAKVFPRGDQKGLTRAVAAFENVLIGHVLAYRKIHDIYNEKGWSSPVVTTNAWCSGMYSMDRLAQDLFMARTFGINRQDLPLWLNNQKQYFRSLARTLTFLTGPQWLKRGIQQFLDEIIMFRMGKPIMPHLQDLIYQTDNQELLDAVSFDFYDPMLGNNLETGFPVPVRVLSKPWQWNVAPQYLGVFLDSYASICRNLPIYILENGMAYQHDGNKVYPRKDGALRDHVLKATFLEMIRALKKGVPLAGYCYWSLLDNYEWGSFQPRFGLFGVDYNDNARRLPVDILGTNAPGAYKLFVEAFKHREKRMLRQAFQASEYPRIDG